MKRKLLHDLLIGILPILLIACNNTPHYRIGVSQCSSDDWRSKANSEIMREAMFHDDVDVEIRSGEDDNTKQISDIQYFIDNNFDLIIASPRDANAVTPIIKKAYNKGIPIVLFDRNTNEKCYTAYQGTNNALIGRHAAQLAISQLGENIRIFEICGLPGSTPAIERERGFDEIVAQHPGMTIVGKGSADWNEKEATAVIDSLLDITTNVDLIFAHNDRMAIAASKAVKKRGLKGIKIYGIDASPTIGLKAVDEGLIDASFLYPTEGQQLVRTAVHILKGEPFDSIYMPESPMHVDKNSAELLLLENEALNEETSKVAWLKSQVDDYWDRHSAQTTTLYLLIGLLVLLCIVIFLILKAYWTRNRHQLELTAQNEELQRSHNALIEANKQAEEATRAKLMFFTNVSHDLRTPLTLIADPIHQVKGAENLTDKQNLLMNLADKNVNVLLRLINQILDFRKYESGKLTLNISNIDMRQCLEEWVNSFKSLAVKKHIHLSLNIEGEKDMTMGADPEKMERIIFNLLSNAFKFTDENGEIKVSMTRDDDKLHITVSDTGKGMEAEHISRIFDQFYQVDNTHHAGSGIGLALVKSFVELHNGTISVESQVNKGTVFTILLPIKLAQKDAQQPTHLISAQQVNEELAMVEDPEINVDAQNDCVLVIDDNPDIRAYVKSILCDKYTVIEAANGRQGIKLATKYVPDMIVCDVMMPDIDGMETCRQLKNEMTTSHIPILMLTACSLDEQRIEGYNCGADGYMAKPFNSELLISQVNSLITNRKRIKDISAIKVEPATPKSTAAKVGDIDNEFIAKLKKLIDEEMSDADLNVEELGQRMGVSRVQLYRKVKALTQYTPVELLRIMRLKKAASLIASTEDTIAEIAYHVGFSSPGYFAKCYKEYFGELPTEHQARTSKINS